MSRTYRRKSTTQNGMWADLGYFTSEYAYKLYDMEGRSFNERYMRIPFEKGSPEYQKGKAKFHSDAGTQSFKEPGPSWFRRMFHKMYKSHVRQELHKFMRDPDYEVDLHDSTEKYFMDYWT